MAEMTLNVELGEEVLKRIEEIKEELAAVQEVIEVFRPMVQEWREGRHVTKLCYGLNNDHMKALDALIKMEEI